MLLTELFILMMTGFFVVAIAVNMWGWPLITLLGTIGLVWGVYSVLRAHLQKLPEELEDTNVE